MIVDAFMFYNELDVLEWRLKTLDPYVDVFVLVESDVTHIGTPKDLVFEQNKERYTHWLPKIRHVIAKDMPVNDPNPWSREKHQRHCVLDGLGGIPDDALVMISDVDEIPDMTKVGRPKQTVSCHMHMFEYSFKYTFTGEPWFGTVVTDAKAFRKLGPNFFRDNRWRFPYIHSAGWHVSSFGDADHVYRKLKTYAHAKDPGRDHQTLENVEKMLSEGIHHTGGNLVLTPQGTSRPPGAPKD